MGYKYILGDSGTGKTELCLSQIINAQNDGGSNAVIYIVPEQFSLQSEKNLLTASQGKGLMRARVLSFQRLSYFVFSEFGGTEKPILQDTGKNILLRKVMLELSDKLKFFKGAVDKQGFIDNLSSTVTEFYQYDISPAAISEALGGISQNDNLQMKMHDLYLIFTNYQDYLEKNYISADETLDILAEKVSCSKLINNAEIWIDGFKSFTPQEYKVIEKLLINAKSVVFSLTLDELSAGFDGVDGSDPFFETKNAVNIINELAHSNSIEQEQPVYLNKNLRYKNAPDLEFLTKNFFRSNAIPFKDDCGNIKIVYADNMNDEIHYAAKKITNLVMERNYRFNEIAVVSCAPSDYEKNIKIIFSQYDLPVFIDMQKDILSHPLVEFIRSALEIIAYNWQYESVFRLLKTNMLRIPREKIDLLENYVLAYGIKRDRWQKPWIYGFGGRYEQFDEVEMNELRLEIIGLLEPLTGSFNKNGKYSVFDITATLYSFIKNCGVTDVLEDWISKMYESGQIEIYREHNQIWGKVVALMDKMVEVLGNEKLSIAEYGKILEAGFSGTKMSLAPHSLDQIIIGDLRRTRLPEVKALFLLGANEGMLPAKMQQNGLFSDEDRIIISRKMKIKLAADNIARAGEEQLSIYTCLSKPSEFLSLSCFQGGLDGKALRPSVILDKISDLMPQIEKITLSRISERSLDDVSPAKPMFNGFTALLRSFAQTGEIPDVYKDIYTYFISHEKYGVKLKEVKKLMNNINKPENLSEASISELYSAGIKSSVSKLEKYAGCPFSYFVQYNLSAKERKLYEVASVDLGNVFHAILEKFSLHLNEENISMGLVDKQTLERLAAKSADETFSSEENEILSSSGQYQYLAERVKELSIKSIYALAQHMRNGEFELAFTEASFSSDASGQAAFGTIQIPLADNVMQLEGRIDRVDIAEIDGTEYVKIIDYKSGNKKFSFAEVFYGLQLQLIIYMDAFINKYEGKYGQQGDENSKINPAAVFYFRLLNPVIDYSAKLLDLDEDELQSLFLKQYKMSGVVLNDAKVLGALDNKAQKSSDIFQSSKSLTAESFKILMDYCMKKAKQIGNEILSGDISAAPYQFRDNNACKYCAYKSVCKFDPSQNPQKHRKLKSINDKEALLKIFSDFTE